MHSQYYFRAFSRWTSLRPLSLSFWTFTASFLCPLVILGTHPWTARKIQHSQPYLIMVDNGYQCWITVVIDRTLARDRSCWLIAQNPFPQYPWGTPGATYRFPKSDFEKGCDIKRKEWLTIVNHEFLAIVHQSTIAAIRTITNHHWRWSYNGKCQFYSSITIISHH